MDEPHTPEKIRVWRRPVRVEPPDGMSHPSQDVHYISRAPRNASEQTPKDLSELGLWRPGVQVFKYKKVENRVRPVPAIMPEEAKVHRTFP